MNFTTKNTTYTLTDAGDGGFFISGNETYCPKPTLVTIRELPQIGAPFWFTLVERNKLVVTTRVQSISGEV